MSKLTVTCSLLVAWLSLLQSHRATSIYDGYSPAAGYAYETYDPSATYYYDTSATSYQNSPYEYETVAAAEEPAVAEQPAVEEPAVEEQPQAQPSPPEVVASREYLQDQYHRTPSPAAAPANYRPGRFYLIDGHPHPRNGHRRAEPARTSSWRNAMHNRVSSSVRSTSHAKPDPPATTNHRSSIFGTEPVPQGDGTCMCSCACPTTTTTTTTTPRPCRTIHANKKVFIRHAVGFDPDSGDTVNVKERCY